MRSNEGSPRQKFNDDESRTSESLRHLLLSPLIPIQIQIQFSLSLSPIPSLPGSDASPITPTGMSDGEENPAAVPVAPPDVQGDGRWMSQHNRFVADTKDKEPDVLFVGDSLVQLLQQFEIWRELFSPLHALNFGVGGDATQHVLWRLQHGELENIRPKVVVVWVGTNNHGHSAQQVAEGIEAIVRLIHQRQAQAKVIVLGLLPRGRDPNPLRVKNELVNELVCAALGPLPNATFLETGPGLVATDGSLSHHDLYDYLHLTRDAYGRLCPRIHRAVLQALGEAAGTEA